MTKNNKPQLIAKLRNEQSHGYDIICKVDDGYILKSTFGDGLEGRWIGVGKVELEHVLSVMYDADVARSVISK